MYYIYQISGKKSSGFVHKPQPETHFLSYNRHMKKKILFVITKSVWGGAQKYVYDLATNLSTDRFDAIVAAGGNGPLFEKLTVAGIRTIRIPELDRDVHIGKELQSLSALQHLFRYEKPDIVHLNSSKVGGLGALAARIASVYTKKQSKIIFTVHGWGFLEDRPMVWRIVIFFASFFSTLLQHTVILINTRDYTAARRFIQKRKRVLIPNGLSPHTCIPAIQARSFFSEKLHNHIPEDAIVIGTIAELTKNKGLD